MAVEDVNLFIDRLVQTITINSDEHDEIKFLLDQMLEEERLLPPKDGDYSNLVKSYRFAYLIPFGSDCFCTLKIFPRKPNNRFMRIDWNPASALRACQNPFEKIIDLLSEIIPSFDFEFHIMGGNVTRMDLTFDLVGVSIDSISVHTILRKSVSGRYYYPRQKFHRTGYLNSIEIGKPDGDKYLLIYNKKLEQESRRISRNPRQSASPAPNGRRRRVEPECTRFELRLGTLGSLGNLQYSENPFAAYSVESFLQLSSAIPGHAWYFFLNSCKLIGTQATLSAIAERRERKKYSDSIKTLNPPPWWNPDDIWAQFPGALLKLFDRDEAAEIVERPPMLVGRPVNHRRIRR